MAAQVKAVGNLIKCRVENIETDSEYKKFLDECVKDKLILQEVLLEFHELYPNKDKFLLEVSKFKSQMAVIKQQFDVAPYSVLLDDEELEFIVLHELDLQPIENIKNAEELSGCGKVLSKFELGFMDYPRKFTRDNSVDFFELEPDELILNSVILTIDNDTPTLAPKLTGRAAEIAARRAREKTNTEEKN